MRKLEILAVVSAIALVSSCSKNEIPGYLSDPDAVCVEAVVGPLTRSNPVGTPEEQKVFNEGDLIGISNGGDFVNYILTDGSWVPENASEYLKWENNTMTFRAYYPANNASTFEIGDVYTYQSDEYILQLSDYMTAEVTADRPQTGNSLSLRLERRTARVIVRIDSFREEFDGTNPSVSAVKVYSSLKVPYSDLSSPVPIESLNKDGIFYALVCPSEARPDQPFLELTVEYGDPKQTKTLTVRGVPAMEAGKSYTYSVLVGKTSVKVGSVSVRDWTTGEAIDDGLTDVMASWSGKAEPFALTDASGSPLGGSESTPILIENPEQFAYLAERVNAGESYSGKYFRLTDDINLAKKSWTPIGNSDNPFSGNFDGGSKTIYGLNVSSTNSCVGLFGYAKGAYIARFTVYGHVESLVGDQVGGIVGYMEYTTMEGCDSEVTVKGKTNVGGLCGGMANCKIAFSAVWNCLVESTGDGVGGLVGAIQGAARAGDGIDGSAVITCVVKGSRYVGGLVGDVSSSPVLSHNTARVDLIVTTENCGGLVGRLIDCNSEFEYCDFSGIITSDGANVVNVGAFIGYDGSATRFWYCRYDASKTGDLPVIGKSDGVAVGKDYSEIFASEI